MLGRMRTALKFFSVGLAAGVLFAPRGGAETRHQIRAWIMREN
ncbi:MAG: YtxH domain-containing protein [Thermomicrobiales bacterium]|nr:YtxH domain-containing protein [Thermomicrobiales bacterium]